METSHERPVYVPSSMLQAPGVLEQPVCILFLRFFFNFFHFFFFIAEFGHFSITHFWGNFLFYNKFLIKKILISAVKKN
jgi:hypothetical protein